jgi:hypothetical protein
MTFVTSMDDEREARGFAPDVTPAEGHPCQDQLEAGEDELR